MAFYKYVAYDFYGKVKKGRLEAYNSDQAKKLLRDQGYKVDELEEVKESIWTKQIFLTKPVKTKDFVAFIQQFSALVEAGLTVLDSIMILREQTKNKHLSKALYYIEIDLRQGNSLASSMRKHPNIFPNIFVNVIHSAEVSGSLNSALDELGDYYSKRSQTAQKVKSSMAYPLTVLFVAVIVVIFLLSYVVPQFSDLFNQYGAELPSITQMVLMVSEFMLRYWLLIILIILLIVVMSIMAFTKEKSRHKLDRWILSLPIIGTLIMKSSLANVSRTLSSLLTNGIPIIQAIELTKQTIINREVQNVLEQSKQSLKQGNSFVQPMIDHGAFPLLVTQMLSVGEKTGSLEKMLKQVASFYEDDVDTASEQLKSLLEPILIIFLSIIVGTIVLSIIIPMFDLYQQI